MISLAEEHCNRIDGLAKALRGKDDALLASKIIDFEAADTEPVAALCQRGVPGVKGAVERIVQVRGIKYGDALADTVEKQLNDFEACKEDMNHKKRRQILEDAIRMLHPIVNETPNARLLTQLARAYLHRGLLFRPRGFTTPARKTEAIKKARALSEEVLKQDEKNVDAWRIWGYASLELKLINDHNKIPVEKLKSAGDAILKDGVSRLNDLCVLLKYAEHLKNRSFLKTAVLNETRDWERPYDLLLFKAKASFLLGKKDGVKKHAEKAIRHPPFTLADPFWDSLAEFLKTLWTNKKDGWDIWKKLSVLAHSRCAGIEKQISSSIYLRQHWARQKYLYDLAFLAAKTPKERAKIADSLKGRAVLRDQALQELKDDKIRTEFLEMANESRDGRYLKKSPSLKREYPDQYKKDRKKISDQIKRDPVPLESLPDPWIAVHFYLNDLETSEGKAGGHALIFDAETGRWKAHTFDYRKLHQSFLKWQELYSFAESDQKCEVSSALVSLCREIGRTLPFLFELPGERPVLWIPHGFLHRLPLHAAINPHDENKLFLEQHVSRYLPAWHTLDKDAEKKTGEGKAVLLKNYPGLHAHKFEGLIESREWNTLKDPATPEHFGKYAKGNPALLTILCHGHGDILNPFNSCLDMKDEKMDDVKMSLLDIFEIKPELRGTQVLLGACESDMAPPAEHTVDEHLSLSTVLLSHKAAEVVAGLWEIGDENAEECYIGLIESSDFAEELREWQTDYIEVWLEDMEKSASFETDPNAEFYLLAPFRVMGFPETLKTPDRQR